MTFSINEVFRRTSADLVKFTEEILNEKLHFLCSDTQNFEKILTYINVS